MRADVCRRTNMKGMSGYQGDKYAIHKAAGFGSYRFVDSFISEMEHRNNRYNAH